MKELKNFERKKLFDYYNSKDNPFLFVVTEIDVTKVLSVTKKLKTSFYASMGYLVVTALNQIENFKLRFCNGKFFCCDNLNSNYVQMLNENEIGFFAFAHTENYFDYIKNFKTAQKDCLSGKQVAKNSNEEVWLSCVPWFQFTGLITPFQKTQTTPQIIWDKYEKRGRKFFLHIMIMAHHGFVDGFHVSKFVENLKNNILNFENVLKTANIN